MKRAPEKIIPILVKRFLLSKTSDGFLSLISWVSVLGVALGVMALTIATSVINGFEGELIRVITNMNGDVVLYSRGDAVRNPEDVKVHIRNSLPELSAVSSSFVTELMVSGPHGVAGAVLQGVEVDQLGLVTTIPRQITQGQMPGADQDVVLGATLAEKLGLSLGGELRIIAPLSGGADGAPKVLAGRVVGILKMGMNDYDSKFVLMTLSGVQKFLEQEGKVTNFTIKLERGANARAAADRLGQVFEYPFRAKDWSQLNRNLFYAIQLEKAVIAIILAVIVIVAAFNVVSTLMMMIHDKTKEIAILKAMGFQKGQSFRLFCWIGLTIGITGIALGIVSGLGIGFILKSTRLIQLPPDIYNIGFLPVKVWWREIGLIAVCAVFVSFLATLYPAWSVSRRPPLEGLRYE